MSTAVRRALDLLREPPSPGGWATTSFIASMTRGAFTATALWQFALVGAVLTNRLPAQTTAELIAIHLAVGLTALSVRMAGRHVVVVLLAAYVAFLADWSLGAVWDGTLLFVSVWAVHLASATPALTGSRPRVTAVPVAAAFVVPPLMLLARPDLGVLVPFSILMTELAIVVALWIGLAYPLAVVRQADLQEAADDEQDRLLAARKAAARRRAEDTRILHDTVINTLGALASGGAATADLAMVRQQCRQDIATVESLRSDLEPTDTMTYDVHRATANLGVDVTYRGLSAQDFADLEPEFSAPVLAAMTGATVELVRNVAKHAEVTQASVEIHRTGETVHITVADRGRGFDGAIVPGRGLALSVIERAAEHGVGVAIDTAPGSGTRVSLSGRIPTTQASASPPDPLTDVSSLAEALTERAAFAAAVGLTAVGLILAVVNHPGQATPEYLMVAIIGSATALTWLRLRRCGRMGTPVKVLLVVAAAAAFACSAAAVGFGRVDVVFWQAIGPVAPLILLVALSRSRRAALVAGAVYALVTVAIALSVRSMNLTSVANVACACAIGLGLVALWAAFQRALLRISHQAAREHRRSALAQRELVARAAAEDVRRRWQSAGLSASVDLLKRIVDGTDPSDAELRARCSAEEAYLRNLIQLDPNLVHAGSWLIEALAAARKAGVVLTVRAGDVDVDQLDAQEVGGLLMHAVALMPPGTRLTVTLFPVDGGVRLTLVAPHPHLERLPEHHPSTRVQNLGHQDYVEVIMDHERPRTHA